MFINELDDIVNAYNIRYNSTIKMKPVNVKSSTYIDFDVENNNKDPKFEVGNHAQISRYKKSFCNRLRPDLCNRSPSWTRNCWNVF